MIKELAALGLEIGVACKTLGYDTAVELQRAFIDFAEAIAKQTRPDAERAALMLLSAGQEMYRSIDDDTTATENWREALTKAERILGIVPLTKAE